MRNGDGQRRGWVGLEMPMLMLCSQGQSIARCCGKEDTRGRWRSEADSRVREVSRVIIKWLR